MTFVVGIDLGTTHTVVAYALRQPTSADDAAVKLFDIDQFIAAGEVSAQPLLPSARYHAAAGELPEASMRLPWSAVFTSASSDVGGVPRTVIGRLARDLGAQVPGRLVTSAKSWLSHDAVDRTAAILPWGADDSVDKVSPVAASASYLAHVRAAWNTRFPKAPLETQSVVLTVPASFDEGARAFTVEAARRAGLPRLRLIEEPQAALYDWLLQHRDTLNADLAGTRLVLVCDVGGGTTDLSLIRVDAGGDAEDRNAPMPTRIEHRKEPMLTRIGVGDHLMLGGDNMDLALAHLVEQRLATSASASAPRLSAAQMSQLTQRCRAAKEQLLAADAPESVAVTLLGGGARLVGGSRSATLARDEVRHALIDGFFPEVDATERPARRRGGIVEFGLPYASDPAITRHVAAFLAQHAAAAREALGEHAPADSARLPMPDTLLLNGGVFRAAALGARMADTLGRWRGAPLQALHNPHLDAAVARGAVAYGLAREGRAPRIGGGSARSHFLVLQDDAAARQAICVLPRGTAEGRTMRLAERSFALRLGRPVVFHLVSSTADMPQAAGELIDFSSMEVVRLPPLATVVAPGEGATASEVAVQLSAVLTEVGTLELQCEAVAEPSRRWKLEFAVRGKAAADAAAAHPRLPEALERIGRVFGPRAQNVDPKEVRQLRQQLERLLGDRATWDVPLLRALHAALWDGARRRRRSPAHERVWLNLAGYTLRPGFGSPVDAWHVEQMITLYAQGLQHGSDPQAWAEWWTLLRRIAGGLSEDQQLLILNDLAFDLQPPGAGLIPRPPGPTKSGYDDMVRLAASLERVGAEHKATVGDWLVQRLQRPVENVHGWWAVGRLGARQPFTPTTHNVVPAEVATRWIVALQRLDWHKVDVAAFAATQIARLTGDRSRDLSDEVRADVARRLEAAHAPARWVAMVREQVTLDAAEEGRAFGEALPPGLTLIA